MRTSPGTADRIRTVYENADSWNYEVSGDYQFGFGPGKLKLIGLRRFSHEPYKQEIVTTPVGGIATGDRFAQTGDLGVEHAIELMAQRFKAPVAQEEFAQDDEGPGVDQLRGGLGLFQPLARAFVVRAQQAQHLPGQSRVGPAALAFGQRQERQRSATRSRSTTRWSIPCLPRCSLMAIPACPAPMTRTSTVSLATATSFAIETCCVVLDNPRRPSIRKAHSIDALHNF